MQDSVLQVAVRIVGDVQVELCELALIVGHKVIGTTSGPVGQHTTAKSHISNKALDVEKVVAIVQSTHVLDEHVEHGGGRSVRVHVDCERRVSIGSVDDASERIVELNVGAITHAWHAEHSAEQVRGDLELCHVKKETVALAKSLETQRIGVALTMRRVLEHGVGEPHRLENAHLSVVNFARVVRNVNGRKWQILSNKI